MTNSTMNENIPPQNLLDRLSLKHEGLLGSTEEQPIHEDVYYGMNTKAANHLFEFCLLIPKFNLIFFKECLADDLLARAKNFVVSCWDTEHLTRVHSINVQYYSHFAYIERMNYLMAGTGYGTILIYRITESRQLKLLRTLKAFRGSSSQLMEIKNQRWFASYGYDAGSRRKYAIKIWDLYTLQQVVRLKAEIETEVNLVYVESRKCFVVAKDCEIAIISIKGRQNIQRIYIEMYGKKVHSQIYSSDLKLLFLVLELERETFRKHCIMVWTFQGGQTPKQLSLTSDIKLFNPVVADDRCCILGRTEKNILSEFSWNIDNNKFKLIEKVRKTVEEDCGFTKLGRNQLLQIYNKSQVRFWEY